MNGAPSWAATPSHVTPIKAVITKLGMAIVLRGKGKERVGSAVLGCWTGTISLVTLGQCLSPPVTGQVSSADFSAAADKWECKPAGSVETFVPLCPCGTLAVPVDHADQRSN